MTDYQQMIAEQRVLNGHNNRTKLVGKARLLELFSLAITLFRVVRRTFLLLRRLGTSDSTSTLLRLYLDSLGVPLPSRDFRPTIY